MSYPEHDKLSAVHDKSQAIGSFMEWLSNEKRYFLSTYDIYDRLTPVSKRIEDLLAEFFDIDLKKLEAEKRDMLESIRETASKAVRADARKD